MLCVHVNYWQVVQEYESQIRHWQKVCEEVGREKKRRSLTVSDMDKEVSGLKYVSKLLHGPCPISLSLSLVAYIIGGGEAEKGE